MVSYRYLVCSIQQKRKKNLRNSAKLFSFLENSCLQSSKPLTRHKLSTTQSIMSSWHFVDVSGQTKGPVTLENMKQSYANGSLLDGSHVWNGEDVSKWTPLKNVPYLLKKVKQIQSPQPVPPKFSMPPPPPKHHLGEGGKHSTKHSTLSIPPSTTQQKKHNAKEMVTSKIL